MAKVNIEINATDEASKVIQRTTNATDDLAHALTKLVVQERNNKIMEEARKQFANLTETEKKYALAAYDAAEAQAKLNDSAEKSGGSWTELKSQIDLVTGATEKVYEGAKKIYEFGRAGAELEYAAVKFDRLSQSIGTTSDALLKDLREATKGTLSDMELMASAADLAGLGLAKNHDQVVRLSKVVGGLGMDMNQLVLTLANQTTMRFDQLGVSVVGFDEKVKALEESGMSASDAFAEAFLQQAEEQLEKVGNKADESIGKFERFEAALKNLGDQAKREASPALATLAGEMAKVLELSVKNQGNLAGITGGYGRAIGAIADMTDAEERARDAAQRNARVQEEAAVVQQTTIDVTNQQAWAIDAMAESYEGAGRAAAMAAQNAEAMAAASSSLADAQTQLANAETSWKEGAGGELASMLENRVGAGDRYKEGLKAIDEVMGTSLVTEQQMKDQQKALIDEFSRTGDVDKFKEGMQALNDTFMPLNESVEKATTLVQTLQEKIDTLTGKTYTVLVRAQVSGDISGAVTAAVTGAGTSVTKTTTTANKHGGEREYADGGSFTIPPGYEDHTWPVGPGRWAQTGEQVTITPKGESAGGITINVNGAGDPGMVAEMVYQKLRSSLRGYGGAYAGG